MAASSSSSSSSGSSKKINFLCIPVPTEEFPGITRPRNNRKGDLNKIPIYIEQQIIDDIYKVAKEAYDDEELAINEMFYRRAYPFRKYTGEKKKEPTRRVPCNPNEVSEGSEEVIVSYTTNKTKYPALNERAGSRGFFFLAMKRDARLFKDKGYDTPSITAMLNRRYRFSQIRTDSQKKEHEPIIGLPDSIHDKTKKFNIDLRKPGTTNISKPLLTEDLVDDLLKRGALQFEGFYPAARLLGLTTTKTCVNKIVGTTTTKTVCVVRNLLPDQSLPSSSTQTQQQETPAAPAPVARVADAEANEEEDVERNGYLGNGAASPVASATHEEVEEGQLAAFVGAIDGGGYLNLETPSPSQKERNEQMLNEAMAEDEASLPHSSGKEVAGILPDPMANLTSAHLSFLPRQAAEMTATAPLSSSSSSPSSHSSVYPPIMYVFNERKQANGNKRSATASELTRMDSPDKRGRSSHEPDSGHSSTVFPPVPPLNTFFPVSPTPSASQTPAPGTNVRRPSEFPNGFDTGLLF